MSFFMIVYLCIEDNVMTIDVTRASRELEQKVDSVTPYEVISLLLEGALERVEQAQETLSKGDTQAAGELMGRLVGIVNGLRNSLDFDNGGEVAVNLDSLYEYITARILEAEEENGLEVLSEAGELLSQVKDGWQGIAA